LDITPTKHSKLYVTSSLSYLPNPSVQNTSTVRPKSASHVLMQYSWPVSLETLSSCNIVLARFKFHGNYRTLAIFIQRLHWK